MSKNNKKYEVKISPDKKPEIDFKKHKDFKSVHKAYTHWAYRYPWHKLKRHGARNRRLVMYIILAVVIAALVFTEC